jgi:membrane protein DedA with SNARE-associated domain
MRMHTFLTLVLVAFLVSVTVLLVTGFHMIWSEASTSEFESRLMASSGLVAGTCVFTLAACRTVVDLRRSAGRRNDDASRPVR